MQTLDRYEDEGSAYLVKELAGDVEPDDYVDLNENIASSMPAVDVGSIAWRREIREEIFENDVVDVSSDEGVDEDTRQKQQLSLQRNSRVVINQLFFYFELFICYGKL